MSIATVHYLSMSARDGIVTAAGAFAEQVAQTITPSRLQPSKGYTIDWGDDSSDTTFTSNSSGTTTAKSHTYESGGTYTIEVRVTASGQVAAKKTVTVSYNNGTIAADGTVTEGVEETFTLASLPADRELVIDWGDETDDTVTTNGSGTITQTHTYDLPGTYDITVVDPVTSHEYAALTVTVLFNNGTIAADGSVTEGVSETFTLASLPADRDLVIDWDDASDDDFTTSGSGGGTISHTYALPGDFVITVTDPVLEHEYASLAVSVLFNDGTIAADGTVTKDISETFTLASLPANRALVIDWDDSSDDDFTTNGSGGGTIAHTYTAAGSYDITVTDPVLEHEYATLNLTVLAGD